jgi:nitrogen fixation/metabolism regulation signal transduction histidine kinase
MAFSKFQAGLILQAVLLAFVAFAFAWSVHQQYMLVTSISIAIIWILQVILLIRYLNRINRDLTRFLQTFRFSDSTVFFNEKDSDKSFRNLYSNFNIITSAFHKVRMEKESEYRLFRAIFEQVGIGVLVFDETGLVKLANKSFLDMFRLTSINHINKLEMLEEGFTERIFKMKPGRQELIKFRPGHTDEFEQSVTNQVLAFMQEIRQEDAGLKLVTFQNIEEQMDQKEIDAWEKLIRIFNHEIMNSVSPINLLTSNLIDMFQHEGKVKKVSELDDSMIHDAMLGLQTIRRRGHGLSHFVETYRSITKLPALLLTDLRIKELFNRISVLLEPAFRKVKVHLITRNIPENHMIRADEKLVEQVLINLVKNALEALTETHEPSVILESFATGDRHIIQVKDNGRGIPPDIMENIFIPFFTTKEGGSGIGLTFARQVMKLHHGNIRVSSESGKGTTVTLAFR